MFIEKSEIGKFADDNAIYDCGKDLSNILENLKHGMKILLKWFIINSLQANSGEFQFMVLKKKKWKSVKLIRNSTEIEESKKVVFGNIHKSIAFWVSMSMLITYPVEQIINYMLYEE